MSPAKAIPSVQDEFNQIYIRIPNDLGHPREKRELIPEFDDRELDREV